MSETAVELKFDDEMQQMTFNMLSNLINERNSLVGQANAANGDRQTLTEQIRENSTDPEIVAAREAYSEALLALDALVKPKVEAMIADSAGSVTEIEEKIKELDGKLKPGVTYFKKLYADSDVINHLPTQERLKGASVGRTGAGGRRIRGFNVVVTVDGEASEFENFSSAAAYLDVDTTELQKAFFEKAGTDVLKEVPDEVNLVINYVEVDDDENETEKEAMVRAYRTEPTGSNATESEPEVEDEDED